MRFPGSDRVSKYFIKILMPGDADWFGAVEVGDTGLIQQLLPQYKLTVNDAGDTALILAARLNKIGIVRILAAHEHGKMTKDGRTALMIAASRDYPDVCELLAPYEANIYCDRGRDCLMIAAKSVSVESLSVLLKYISYRRDSHDLCALDYAVLAESLVCVRLLLQKMVFQEEVLELSLSLARAKDLGAIETALKEALEHHHSFASSQINVKAPKTDPRDGFKPAVSANNILTADSDASQTPFSMSRTNVTSKIPRPDGPADTPGPSVSKSMGVESFTPGKKNQQPMQRSYHFGAQQQKHIDPKSSVDGFSVLPDTSSSGSSSINRRSHSPLANFTAPKIDTTASSTYQPYVPYDFSTLSDVGALPYSIPTGVMSSNPPNLHTFTSTEPALSALNMPSLMTASSVPALNMQADRSFNSFSEIERNLRLALSHIGTATNETSTPPSARTYQSVLEVVNSPAVKTTKQLINAMAPMVNLINHQSSNTPGKLATVTTAEELMSAPDGVSPLDAIESWKDVQKYITALEGHTLVKSRIAATPPLSHNLLASPLLNMEGSKIYEDRTILSALDAITSIRMSPASRLAEKLRTPPRSLHFPNKDIDCTFHEILLDLPENKKEKVIDFVSKLYSNVCIMESSQISSSGSADNKELEKLRNDYMLQKFEITSQAGIIEALTTELTQLKQQQGLEFADTQGPQKTSAYVLPPSLSSSKLNISQIVTSHSVGTQTDLDDAWFSAVQQNNVAYVKAHVGVMARTKDGNNKTALMHAACNGFIDIAFVLAEHEAGIQQPDGFTALMHAVTSGHYLIVKLLLDYEAYFSTTQLSTWPAGCTALMLAAHNGNIQSINVLLEKLCTERDVAGNTALYYAVVGGSAVALSALLSKSIMFELRDIDAALAIAQEKSRQDFISILQPLRQNKEANMQKYIRECSELKQRVAELEAARLVSGQPYPPNSGPYTFQGSGYTKQHGSSRPTSASTVGHTSTLRGISDVHEMGSMDPRRMHEIPARVSEDDILSALQHAIENRRNSITSVPIEESVTTATPSLFTPGFATIQQSNAGNDDYVSGSHANGVHHLHKERPPLEPNTAASHSLLQDAAHRPSSAATALAHIPRPIDRRVSVINTTISPMVGTSVVSEAASPTINTNIVRTTMPKQQDDNSLFRAITSKDIVAVQQTMDIFSRKQDQQGVSPLMYAIQVGFVDAALLLTDLSAGLADANGKTALMYAVEYDRVDVARKLVDKEAGMQTKDLPPYPLYTALMLAVTLKKLELVKLLAPVEAGKRNSNDETALMIAAKLDYADAVYYLLNAEAGIMTKDGQVALAFALEAGNLRIAELLAPREASNTDDILPHDGKSCTELMQAAELNDIVQVYSLLAKQAKLTDRNGRTGLMVAAERGYLGIIHLLIPYEAKMQMSGRGWNNGTTALMLAASKGNVEACRILLPIEGRMQNKEGRTALMFAAWNGCTECVKLLKDTEARMTTTATYELGEGFTALMAAATNGHEECVRLLLNEEADIIQPDKKSTLYWANDNRIRELLKGAC
ncbi:Protein 21.1 [Giardia duodenalis assemblage B]|uniref:Protein 21.1 n=1 Tax=Giardia duodenalis assemblage B TaxID=1394984 RepID=A0A132NQ59_GIAIN|nr:Protein 21.1 [Giardia intestinalis assemblage B]